MLSHILESWVLLMQFEISLWRGRFDAMHGKVRREPVATQSIGSERVIKELCLAMDYACVLYFKQVLCLQRSCATTLLLRRHGCKAEMVIGAQLVPFRSHAWVESDGVVINDKSYVTEIYQVLERC